MFLSNKGEDLMLFTIICPDQTMLKKLEKSLGKHCWKGIEIKFSSKVGTEVNEGYCFAVVNYDQNPEAVDRDFDVVIEYTRKEDSAAYATACIEEYLEGYSALLDVSEKLKQGIYKVAYQEYQFGACHEFDRNIFRLMTLDGNSAGSLRFLDRSEIELSLPNKRCFVEGTSGFMKAPTPAYKAAKEVVQEVMRRDDMEYMSLHSTEEGELLVPCTYCDISRQEAIENIADFEPDAFSTL